MEQQLGFEWIAASTICGSHSFDNLRWVGKFIEIAKLPPAGDRTHARAATLKKLHRILGCRMTAQIVCLATIRTCV